MGHRTPRIHIFIYVKAALLIQNTVIILVDFHRILDSLSNQTDGEGTSTRVLNKEIRIKSSQEERRKDR
jgi:hypothetical protein